MQTYRVYFMRGNSIVAAEMVEARCHAEAADSATHAMGSFPWRTLNPDRLEVWQGATFHQAAVIGQCRKASRV
jgi:hypothetical protein